MSAWSKVRVWAKDIAAMDAYTTSQGGTKGLAAKKAATESTEEKLVSTMEGLEVVPPFVITPEGEVNRKTVEFYVSKIVDAAFSGVGAAFLWLIYRMTGKKLWADDPAGERAEVLLPLVAWVGCFVALQFVRSGQRRKATRAAGPKNPASTP